MAETPIPITTGNGSASIAGDLVSGNTYQQIKLVDGTIGGNTPLKVNADGSITASIYGNITTTPAANQSVSGTVGASIIGIVPITQTSTLTVGIASIAFQGSAADNISAVNIGLFTNSNGYVFSGTGWDRSRGNATIGTLVTPYSFPSSFVSGVTSVITGTSSVQVLAPAPATNRNYITNVLVTNAAAVGTTVQLYDGGNVIYVGYAAASGGGFAVSFPAPLKQSSIAGNLSALSSIQASVYVSASGYTAA